MVHRTSAVGQFNGFTSHIHAWPGYSGSTITVKTRFKKCSDLGIIYELHLQDEVGGPKISLFVNIHTIENINTGG